MQIGELLKLVKGSSMSTFVCQTEIKTEQDKLKYDGYLIPYTAEEMQTRFGIDPQRVFYSYALALQMVYFNKDSLAVAPLHLLGYTDMLGKPGFEVQKVLDIIEERESEAASGIFSNSIWTLQDAMRIEYLDLLVKSGKRITDLYKLFFDVYCRCEYGFNLLPTDSLDVILATKTDEQKAATSEALAGYDDIITVYRGENSDSTPHETAMSWSTDINIANFFASRHGDGPGHIYSGHVLKSNIIDVYNGRNESEIIVYPGSVSIYEDLLLPGLDHLNEKVDAVVPLYQQFMADLYDLEFSNEDSDGHDRAHAARVMLLCLLLAQELGLASADKEILCATAIYHDTCRETDGIDTVHGKYAAEYYNGNTLDPNPIVAFLCEYHCISDNDALEALHQTPALAKDFDHIKLLYQIFKDCDALDRVRFGVRDLDMNYLRLPAARRMTLIARLINDHVKID